MNLSEKEVEINKFSEKKMGWLYCEQLRADK